MTDIAKRMKDYIEARPTANHEEATFLVSGIPREYDDLDGL